MRSLVILSQQIPEFLAQFKPKGEGIFLNSTNFAKAKQFLGQEYSFAVFDLRATGGIHFSLEALAIIAGTIRDNGTLFLLCSYWENLENEVDFDSLRWNEQQAINCPHFYRHFKHLVEKFGFEIDPPKEKIAQLIIASGQNLPSNGENLTPEQQFIFQNLPLDPAEIHLITAPRGRGKSTLSGKLAEKLSHTESVLITARSHAALPSFWRQIESEKVTFYAPDKLLQLIDAKQISEKHWLFIDEAASLPLPMLHQFCAYFQKVVLTTTTHNYEGTGRGFSLKFLPQLCKPTTQWQLTKPLRFHENDKLEAFINALLLLEPPAKNEENQPLATFYHLLAEAHYKTTPSDLRRLFDASGQILLPFYQADALCGGVWALNEGGLGDELGQAIWRGERRPQGSLVAQYLCFQGNLPMASQLRSVRISRIAVQAEWQQKGIGTQLIKRLISDINLQNQQQNQPLVDFLSVSFGLTAPLLHFWQRCGFELVQITPNLEASSGYRSAMMIYPLTAQGKQFATLACQQFARDFALLLFFDELATTLPQFTDYQPLADWQLQASDWQNLHGFAYAKRTISACYASLKRFERDCGEMFIADLPTKSDIEQYRTKVRQYLEKKGE